ncbi:MAG: hypothetical protein HQM16_10625 [Deltaproteobacteria bacterium]|nr:hypothetical protein [Deltaproteobacteria bacterium]
MSLFKKSAFISFDYYLINSDFDKKSGEFENLIHSIPDKYLQRIPEMRLGSPYVVRITEDGVKYIQNGK